MVPILKGLMPTMSPKREAMKAERAKRNKPIMALTILRRAAAIFSLSPPAVIQSKAPQTRKMRTARPAKMKMI